MYICISIFVALAHAVSKLKSWNHEINHKKKKLNPWNTDEKKNSDPQISTRKSLDPRSKHEKKFQTHEIPTRKTFLQCDF